ncbi:type III secretion system gatekeeper subunit SctW [Pseudomonas gingeri]|uniref:Type III secretion system gatekeeper subunit SctW n=1 Tax=Pseudomonas gingeri TaxID=117681 RepID=A0A7Y7Y9L4_9PSED|nr:type III secretion system gatekeeper subunit SctW [Pseudomonas gingeri]NWA02056.1 type III secretion system gatekeeper subunit SctW [Pseudomonas gingeri]NWA18151.1 type III secretion system gatekeeper subunit SctW [Pseudomonas gingeri]NWA56268.1 type III secretion system gatekeeper subunit SctW [Pseudomonas gingeri]NWA98846.1 type III secretion system gatekeeper subunit SctW [Pseudomonas gingeri]NWB04835.1 type III secretion system gatekeeper subunit SctW [Pseudomonas gingeri]
MKIAAPTLSPIQAPVINAPAKPAALIAQSTPHQDSSAQQVTRFASALVLQSRSLSQRDLMASSTALQSKAVKLGELYQLLMGTQDKGLDEAARALRRQLKNQAATLAQVLAFSDGDAAKAHVTLQAAAKQAQDEGDDNEHVVLSQQLKLLRREHGSRAQAGMNTARAFARSTLNPRRRQNLRDLYYSGVVGQQTISSLIDTLLGLDEGERQFEPTLRDLRGAIADDLAALSPSSTQQQLRNLMHGLNTARHVATLLQNSEHLLGRMRGKNPTLQLSAPSFLKHLLTLSGKGMNLQETLQLTQYIGGPKLKHQLAFLNGLRPMLQQLPILLWRDLKARQNALGNLLLLMAELTRQEQSLPKGKSA